MNISIKNIFLLPLILLFFPAFCIWISVKPIVIYYIAVIAIFAVTFFLRPKYILSKVNTLYKISAFKYYLLFALWCILSGVILVAFGKYQLSVFIYYVFSLLLVDYGMTYILPFLVYDNRKFNIQFFAKLLLTIYFIIFLVGILEFFGKTFQIDLLKLPSEILGNQRIINNINYIDGSWDRVRSIFAEPGWLGGFIFFNMPILYNLTLSKFKIFKNNIINFIIKKSLIPLMWITIIIEQSAIWLVFNLLLTVFYFRQKIIRFFNKYFSLFVITALSAAVFIIILLNSGSSFDLGFYNRIFNFFVNIFSFDELVTSDPSLGCRLVSYIITIKIGLKNWLLGIGLGNTGYVFPSFYVSSKLPFVGELEANFAKYSLETAKMNFNSAIPYEFFAETGVIGLCLFYLFIFKTIKFLNKVKKYFYNLEYDFVKGLSLSIIATSIIIFYDIPIAYYYIWFLFGLSNIFIYKAGMLRK